jgi:hypothetical protein
VGEMGEGMMGRRLFDLITEGRVKWKPLPDVYDVFVYPNLQIRACEGEANFRRTLHLTLMGNDEGRDEAASAIEMLIDKLGRRGVPRFPALPTIPKFSCPVCRCFDELEISEFHCPQTAFLGAG